jgi:hypothetical protein
MKSLCQPQRQAFERQIERVLNIIDRKLKASTPDQRKVTNVDRAEP